MINSTRPSTLTIFVAGVDNFEEAWVTKTKQHCAYGVYYDSTRYLGWNFSAAARALGSEAATSILAVQRAIMYILQGAPRCHGLIIETDEVSAALAINDCIMSRDKDRAAALKMESELKDPRMLDCVGKIVDLIEFRTKRGDCFVDIVDSSKDSTAKEGLRRARSLAHEALQKILSYQAEAARDGA